jgi:cytochrome c-type biogenesis protein CcmH/NrfG
MAILPASVLISDPASEWMKLGVPLVLQQDLKSARFVAPSLAASESNASQIAAQDILRTKIDENQGKIHVELTVTESTTQKTTQTAEVEASSEAALIPALNTLAKKLDDSAGDFSTRKVEALKLFVGAAQDPNPRSRMDALNHAVTVDPGFGMGYFLMLELTASMGPEGFKGTLDQAQSHRASFTPYDRARFDLIARQLMRAPISQRATAAEALLKVAPNDVDGLAVVSGIRFLNGDVDGGIEAVNRAISLSPGNANLKAQLAEGLVQSKRFAQAEKVLAQFDQNAAALPELATVILLEGDVARANSTAERFFKSVPNLDYQTILRVSWIELAGDRAKAIAMAEGAKFTNANIRGLALGEAAVWRLMNKDVAGAKKTAELAAQSDTHATPITVVSGLLVSGDEPPEEWRKKVEASQLNAVMKPPILAYGFFLNGHYNEAAAEWRKILDQSEGSDLRARTMLAASLDRAGKGAEARKINVQPFLIREFADVYGSVVFNEMRRLTGLAR